MDDLYPVGIKDPGGGRFIEVLGLQRRNGILGNSAKPPPATC